MRSFRLYTEASHFAGHAFISFKADPDGARAQAVADRLNERGLRITFISGDSDCPYQFGSRQANKWIRRLLAQSILQSRVLLSIASASALKSRWVRQEFEEATRNCRLILLLWFDGPNPVTYFVPRPHFATKYLPSAPVYLIDCRSASALKIDQVGTLLRHLLSVARWRRVYQLVTLICCILMSVPISVGLDLVLGKFMSLADGALGRILGSSLWLCVLPLILFFPKLYSVPAKYGAKKVVHGLGFIQYFLIAYWGFVAFCLDDPISGLLQLPFVSLCGLVFAFAVVPAIGILRWVLISRGLHRTPASELPRGMPMRTFVFLALFLAYSLKLCSAWGAPLMSTHSGQAASFNELKSDVGIGSYLNDFPARGLITWARSWQIGKEGVQWTCEVKGDCTRSEVIAWLPKDSTARHLSFQDVDTSALDEPWQPAIDRIKKTTPIDHSHEQEGLRYSLEVGSTGKFVIKISQLP